MSRGIFRSARYPPPPPRWIPTAPSAVCVSSTFDGDENPLSEGGVWTNAFVGGLQKVSGFVTAQSLVAHSYAVYTGRTWANDQSAKITRGATGSLAGTRVSAGVRMSNLGTSDPYGYIFQAYETYEYYLMRVEFGGLHTVIGTYTNVPALTDVIELKVVGTTLTPILNGTPLAPVVDATYATGSPGMHVLAAAADDTIDTWEGCDVGAPTGIALDGTALLALAASADLTTAIALDGAAALALTTAADLTTAIALTGTAGLVVDATATLTTAIALTGSADLVLSATGDLAGAAAALTGTADLILTASAELTTAIPLTGAADLVLSATGDLAGVGAALDGAASLVMVTSAQLTTLIQMSGSALLTLSATGLLFDDSAALTYLDFAFTASRVDIAETATGVMIDLTAHRIDITETSG